MARLYRLRGDEVNAERCIEEALTSNPRSIAALKLKGDAETLRKVWPTYAERDDGAFLAGLSRAYAENS